MTDHIRDNDLHFFDEGVEPQGQFAHFVLNDYLQAFGQITSPAAKTTANATAVVI